MTMNHKTKLLSKADVHACIDMGECLDICEAVFKASGEGRVVMPAKLGLGLGDGASVIAMPSYIESRKKAGLKWAGGFGGNPARGLPYIMGVILLIDPESGLLLAVMEGGYITDLRTGAQTGVAAKYLAKRNAKTAAIIGAGAQGRMNLRALAQAAELKDVRVADVSLENAERFADEMSNELNLKVTTVPSNREAVDNADIIVTATSADETLVRREWVAPGAFISSIGSHPELDPELILTADKVVVDSWAQNEHKGELHRLVGDGRFKEADLFAELGDVVAGNKPGREQDEEIIVSCLIGTGMLDTGCAAHVYDRAMELGLGGRFDFGQTG
jgi:ornithine cyclodeaminase/alanine dehydrogenase